ncbi:MAG: hydantoinase/oxoprolinase family protein [Chloroflexi bacterium]|nr:hydantoinase/oxoprolinase family protein [Chloroflexota bacterium]
MGYRIGIDVGGTFTDFLVVNHDGSLDIHKTFSTPSDPSLGVFNGLGDLAARRGVSLDDFLGQVDAIVHATTISTNAVLTLTGRRVGLLTTKGIRDALELRRGRKERIYDNKYPPATPLVPRYLRLPVDERVDYKGEVLKTVPEADVRAAAQTFAENDVDCVAICFLNSYANRSNEEEARRLVEQLMPGKYVTVSAEILPEIRFYERLCTAVLNSYVGPVLEDYLSRLLARLNEAQFGGMLLIMKANGGVMSAERAIKVAAGTVFSGPAAGAVAGASYAMSQEHGDCITVDMGGTSCDVALIKDGIPAIVRDGSINRYPLALPMVDIHTIGAGGGSIAWIDRGGLLHMGPRSATASPGPACYGFGGTEATCTDANLVLGYLNPEYFLGGRMKLDVAKAERAIEELVARPLGIDVDQAAAAMYHVINVNMAAAVKEVSLVRGYDPRDFALVVAGGAGPIHAAMIAAELEIPVIIVPRDSSIFTAAGLLMSDLKHDYTRTCYTPLLQLDVRRWQQLYHEMEYEGFETLAVERISKDQIDVNYAADIRYIGQYHEVEVPVLADEIGGGDLAPIVERFHQRHDQIYGFAMPEQEVEIVNVRLTCRGRTEKFAFEEQAEIAESAEALLKGYRDIYLPSTESLVRAPLFDGNRMRHGQRIVGPAMIEQASTSVFVPAGHVVVCDRFGNFRMSTK